MPIQAKAVQRFTPLGAALAGPLGALHEFYLSSVAPADPGAELFIPRCVCTSRHQLAFKCCNVKALTTREVPKQGYNLFLPTRKASGRTTYRSCP